MVYGSLTFVIKKTFSSDYQLEIFRESVKYLLHITNSSQFTAQMKKYTEPSNSMKLTDFRLYLKRSGYTVLNCRAFFYMTVRNRNSPMLLKRVSIYAKSYGISYTDAVTMLDPAIMQDPEIVEKVESGTLDLDILYPKLLDMWFNKHQEALKKHCSRFVSRKLMFLVKSCNIPPTDFVAELLLKGIESYYWAVPSFYDKEDAYKLNFIRRSCTNHGINLINHHTTNKRGRLVRQEDGSFNLLVVSQNQFSAEYPQNTTDQSNLSTIHNTFSEECKGVDTATDGIDAFDLKLSVEKVVQTYRADPKASMLLQLLMGKKNHAFSKWLRAGRHISSGDNTDLLEKAEPYVYLRLAVKFLGIPTKNANTVIADLKRNLVG